MELLISSPCDMLGVTIKDRTYGGENPESQRGDSIIFHIKKMKIIVNDITITQYFVKKLCS